MGWLNLKKIEMKNGHIRKLMNLFSDYEELFLEILKKVEEFDNEVIESALR